jgi:polysaccharide export outer membrane protein
MPNCMRRLRVVHLIATVVAVMTVAICPGIQAQSVVQNATPASPPAAADSSQTSTSSHMTDSLVVGPGDTLHVVVFDSPELEQRVNVSDSGNANFTLIGDVHVAGLSANQVSRTLEGLFVRGHFLTHPNVNVMIEQSATMQVSVLGEVHNPGNYEIGTARNILEIISLAGGLTDAADRHITVKRKQGDNQTSTVFLPNNAGDAIAQSEMVYPGDTVIVPKAGIVYVLGDVNRPGGFYMSRDSKLTVLQAMGMAGGALPTAAAPHSRIVRKDPKASNGYVDIPLPLRAIQNGKKPDVQLQADDVIYVPFSYGRNALIQSQAIFASATSALIYAY